MSLLTDRLREIARGDGREIGFTHINAPQTKRPALLIACELATPDRALAVALVQAGAGAIIVPLTLGNGAPQIEALRAFFTDLPKELDNTPIALALRGSATVKDMATVESVAAENWPVDTVFVPSDYPAIFLSRRIFDLPRVIEIGPNHEDRHTMALASLGPEALVLALGNSDDTELSIPLLLRIRLLAEMVRVPSLIRPEWRPTTDELTVLAQSGLLGLMLPPSLFTGDVASIAASIKEIHETLQSIDRERPEGILPETITGLSMPAGRAPATQP